jgi:uncharacterized membrane-anchored protein
LASSLLLFSLAFSETPAAPDMKQLTKILTFLFASLLICSIALAQDPPKSRAEAEALVASLKYQQGTIDLQHGLASLQVPDQFRFLNGHDANMVLVQLWGNPPQSEPLGMLVPANTSPLSPGCWVVIISYEEQGYVKDKDAEKINYDELLKQIKEGAQKANKEREKQRYPRIEIVGWAAPPRYDQAAHKLYWAKEVRFGNETENTLNYNIRILGRRGVLVLNSVSAMSQLPEIERNTSAILSAVNFSSGNRYADFNPASGDKVASYGVAALVAGGVAAKLGFFKGLWVLILGAKKFIIIGVAAIAAWFRKLFGNKSTPAG